MDQFDSHAPAVLPATPSDSVRSHPHLKIRIGILLAASLLFCEILTVANYSCLLQAQYYSHNAPFFDSVSFYNKLAQVYQNARTTGPLAGFTAWRDSTVFLPWAEAGLIAQFRPLSRWLAVWMQAFWLLPLAASLLRYQLVERKFTAPLALAATVPFFAFRAIFHYSGGLCDFRMDLSLWIFYSLSAVWLLIACRSRGLLPWLTWGAFSGLGCLARATAPVYFAAAFGPLILAHLLITKDRRSISRGFAAGMIVAALICGWFYLANFRALHGYYFVWNHDVIYPLPLKQAMSHVRFAWDHVGRVTTIFCLVFAVVTSGFSAAGVTYSAKEFVKRINWETLYLGIAPVAVLVVQRAGLNPYVSMPAAFGLMLFMLEPVRLRKIRQPGPAISACLLLLACTVVVYSALDGLASQTSAEASPSNMPAHLEIVRRILGDARNHKITSVRFSAGSYARTTNASLTDVMIYEFAMHPDGVQLTGSGLVVSSDNLFQSGEPVDWQQIPGSSDRDRVHYLAQRACNTLNYIVFPDDRSIVWLEREYPDQITDRYAGDLRDAVLRQGNWRPVGTPILESKHQTQIVYANNNLVR